MKPVIKYTIALIVLLALCYLWYAAGSVIMDSGNTASWRISAKEAPISFSMWIVFSCWIIVWYIRKIVKSRKR